jgi:hypothetical protein
MSIECARIDVFLHSFRILARPRRFPPPGAGPGRRPPPPAKDIGEGAIVLGQLLGYDDDSERAAVLDAGLAVRGAGFARELARLAREALGDFRAMTSSPSSAVVAAAVDPELVRRVESIDARLRTYVGGEEAESDFQ